MAGHYLRKRLRTARLARRLAGFSLLLLAATVTVFRLRGIDFASLEILLAIVGTLAAAALLLALASLARVWRRGHQGGGAALAALLLAGLVGAPFALAGALAAGNPPTNMAQTDGIAAAAANAPAGGGAPPAEAAGADEALNGRVFAARASQIYAAVRLVLGDVGWTVSDVETSNPEDEGDDDDAGAADAPPVAGAIPVPTPREAPDEADSREPDPLDRPESGEYRIEAVAASPILGLPSDVEIRIVEDDAQGFLDLRSVSRFGARDFGQNRRFIEDFLARVDAAMVGTVAPAGS